MNPFVYILLITIKIPNFKIKLQITKREGKNIHRRRQYSQNRL